MMTHVVKTPSMPSRHIVSALVFALLSITALMAMSPGTASAGNDDYRCDRGEFCLGFAYHLTGGVYDNVGNDTNLTNDRYVYYGPPNEHLSPKVAYLDETVKPPVYRANSLSAHNNGTVQYRDDVMVYTWFNYTGRKLCIRRSSRPIDLPPEWRNRIFSFRWVTDAECNAARKL